MASSIFLRSSSDLALALVLLAQLLLDGLHLLAQIVVALRLLHLVLHLGLDLGAELLHLDLLGQQLVQLIEPLDHAGGFEQYLLVVGGQEGQRRGDKVNQARGLLDVGRDGAQLVGEGGRFGNDLLELGYDVAHQRLGVRRGSRLDVFESLNLGHHEGLGLGEAQQAHAANALGKDKAALVGHAHNLVHRGDGAHGVHIVGLGQVLARVHLRRHHDGPLLAQGFDQLNGAFAADGQRKNGVRKKNGLPDRQNRNSADSRCVLGDGFLGWSGRLL